MAVHVLWIECTDSASSPRTQGTHMSNRRQGRKFGLELLEGRIALTSIHTSPAAVVGHAISITSRAYNMQPDHGDATLEDAGYTNRGQAYSTLIQAYHEGVR